MGVRCQKSSIFSKTTNENCLYGIRVPTFLCLIRCSSRKKYLTKMTKNCLDMKPLNWSLHLRCCIWGKTMLSWIMASQNPKIYIKFYLNLGHEAWIYLKNVFFWQCISITKYFTLLFLSFWYHFRNIPYSCRAIRK